MSLRLKDFTPYALPTLRWYLPVGILFELIAWAILLIGLHFSGHAETKIESLMILSPTIAIFLGGLSIGRKLQVNTRKTLSTVDGEPILYVRPFLHDESPGSCDSAIAKALKDVAPLVAVGVPQDKLPPPGPLRLYFKDEEWREKVTALMSISRLIIIQPGRSPGIEWEIATAREYFRPEQIYISLLDLEVLKKEERQEVSERLKRQIERVYGIPLPGHSGNAHFIYFDNDWRPAEATIGRWLKFFLSLSTPPYEVVAVPVIREVLRPVFRKRGMKLRVWRTVVYTVVSHSIYGVILYYIMSSIFRSR